MSKNTEHQNTRNLEGQDDLLSESLRRLDSARDALRQAREEHIETENRRDTFISILKAGDSLPKGKTLAGVEDELTVSAVRIEGLTEAVSAAEQANAEALADDVAAQVRELVSPLSSGSRTEEACVAIVDVLVKLTDDQTKANATILHAHRRLKALPEDRYGKTRKVGGVSISPMGGSATIYLDDGTEHSRKDPKSVIAKVLSEVELRTKRHILMIQR